jgi:cysteinyl-tRNA synthetase
LVAERQTARDAKDWAASDRLRDTIQDLGYLVQDTKGGMQVIKK